MFSKLTVFQTANAMAMHAGARQALIAQNVANADTPGYRARDLPAFAQVVSPTSHFAGAMRSTRAGHASIDSPNDVARFKSFSENDLNPNSNGVSLEEEMMRAAEVKMNHERALAIYRSAMQIMRMSVSA